MMNQPFSDQIEIPISYLRQFVYCRRIPWFKITQLYEPPVPGWVKEGQRQHAKQPRMQRHRKLHGLMEPYRRESNRYLEHPSLGIYGYADEVALNERQLVVIEYKAGVRPPAKGARLQALAYVISAQATYSGYECWAVIYMPEIKKHHIVTPTEKDYSWLSNTVAAIRHDAGRGYLPSSSAQEAQCNQCEYFRFCNDR